MNERICRKCPHAVEDNIDFGDTDVPTRSCIYPLDALPDEYDSPLEMPEDKARSMDWFETNKKRPNWCPLEGKEEAKPCANDCG